MDPVGVTVGLISMLSIIAIYFWIVRRGKQEPAEQQ
jgi:hypothetical protein